MEKIGVDAPEEFQSVSPWWRLSRLGCAMTSNSMKLLLSTWGSESPFSGSAGLSAPDHFVIASAQWHGKIAQSPQVDAPDHWEASAMGPLNRATAFFRWRFA
eukprot:2375125-Amphidinium_carterae.1